MSYRSESISVTIKRLSLQYFLPAIQREYVWRPDQIISLFDSIMRGYPISSFLFWELQGENRDKWEVYKFIEDATQGGTHNKPASTAGVHDLKLVLDGQQRLTSLLIGLKGTYTVRLKYKRKHDPKSWVKQRLYLDLFKDPRNIEEESVDGEAGIYYGFAFHKEPPGNGTKHHWFPIGRILDFDSEDSFYEFCDEEVDKLPNDVTKGQITVFRRILNRLYRAIWKDEVIAYYSETDQNYDRVLDIFVRANEGGTKLSKSDLLLSMITSKWGDVNAREEIYGFVDRLNNELTRKNDFSKDFIMKSCLVLTDLPVRYMVQNFSIKNLSKIQANWEDIKSAIERGVDLVNFFGIDRDNLTSANALIPIIYYLLKRPRLRLRGTTPFEVRNASAVRKWLAAALLNGAFGGASDNVLRDSRRVLQKHVNPDDNFPVDEINGEIERSGRTAYFDEYAIDNVLFLTYGRQLTFLALSLLYDENGWGTMAYHQDHVFPQSLFKPKRLQDLGYEEDRISQLRSLMNKLGNLQLLLAHENQEKSDKPFEEWITTRDTGFKEKHLIPDDANLWTLERFQEFVKAREELIRQRLRELFADGEQEE